ncbi:MAG: glutathione S-transferase family protein [Pseudomonadota bacterium]
MKLELVGFKICPFVQRVNILIQHKAIPCVVTYLNPKEPPEWLAVLSPRGKVPLLKVDDSVLFESQVINEFLDETHPPPLLPADPLTRARDRGFVALADDLFGGLWHWMTAKDADKAVEARTSLRHLLNVLETSLNEGGAYFSGVEFGLVDCAFAPFFMRLDLLEASGAEALTGQDLPRVAAYRKALASLPAVQASVVAEFPQLYLGFVKGQGGALGGQLED